MNRNGDRGYRRDGADREREISLATLKASLPIMQRAILATTATALGVALAFGRRSGPGRATAWFAAVALVAGAWSYQVRADDAAKAIARASPVRRHAAYAGALAGIFGLGLIDAFARQSGFAQAVVAAVFMGFLSSGVLAVSMQRSLVVTWASVLSLEMLAALFLSGAPIAGPIVAYALFVTYLTRMSARFYRVYRERFAYQLEAEDREEDFAMLFEQSPMSIMVTNLDGDIVGANRKALDITGYALDELIGRNPRIMKSGKTPESLYRDLWAAVARGDQWTGEFVNKAKDGREFIERAMISPVRDSRGAVKGYIAVKEDVTLQRENEMRLARQHDIIALLLRDFEDQSNDWLWELDAGLRFINVSDRLGQLLGIGPEYGRTIIDRLAELEPEGDADAEASLRSLGDALRGGKPFKELDACVVLGGYARWLSFSAMPLNGPGGRAAGWKGVGRDVTDRKTLERQLYHSANFDDQTGLPNRHRFKEMLGGELVAGRCGVLGIARLGNLDLIRSNLGTSLCGDLVGAFLEELRSRFEGAYTVARLGGDEFAFWSPEAGVYQIDAMNRFAHDMGRPVAVGPSLIQLDVRIGIALYPEDARDASGLFRAADLALNSAMASPRRALMRYQRDLAAAFLRSHTLINDFRAALDAGQFSMVYQPQVDAATGSLIGGEALIRWAHPSMGAVPPGEFVPLAEKSGFIAAMGEWTLARACADAAAWPRPLSVSVNVSGAQLHDVRGLGRAVKSCLAASGLPPSRLVLEITESAMFGDDADVSDALTELRALGVKIALDDFGTGYSSLAYLQRLQLDELKIDQSFVRALDTDPRAGSIISVILELAAVLSLETVAEGVESEGQAEALREAGCGSFQGYLFGKPMPGDAFRRLLDAADGR